MTATTIVKLRVTEALVKDVGRAFARMGPEDLERLGISVGDTVEVEGKRKAICKAMPAYADLRGQSRVQLDGSTRENAGASLDEPVSIRKVQCRPAERVVLAPTNVVPADRDLKYIGSLLDGLPVMEGSKIQAALFGSRSAFFKVESVTPKGAVLIHSGTMLVIGKSQEENGAVALSYEDIGGLKSQLQRIREMIELPLRYPEVFQRLGIDAPKGVLLYGPPGCGKTLIARAIAHETEASFFSISGPEIIHKFYGESEAHLRKIFEEATKKGPSILFIDEIDAIGRSRSSGHGNNNDEREQTLNQLLTEMDGFKDNKFPIIVLAATNRPDILDKALTRPGRFDRQVTLPLPDVKGRFEILKVHVKEKVISPLVNLLKIAQQYIGASGADLANLVNEAVMRAEERNGTFVTMKDFEDAK
ncbi:MAG: AAA family ATPase, partial [bacterium]